MRRHHGFSLVRWWSIVLKELTRLKRDRLTFAMIVGIPILQMALFGYAINTNPKHLDTAIISADDSDITRSFIAAMQNSSYFKIVEELPNEAAGREALARGQLLFVVNIPAGFTRQLLRHERPSLLIEADATDPTATASALAAVNGIVQSVIQREMTGPLAALQGSPAPFDVNIHQLYNPDNITQYNVVPGLMGVVLTLTMVMMTGLAITRERERGTMENLLAMPSTPMEVMTGKLIPYIGIRLIQASIILLAARYIFQVPFFGNIGAVSFDAPVHRRQPDGGHYIFVVGAESATGGAARYLLLSPQHSALRIYVSIQGHAGLGAGDRELPAAHLL